MALLGLVNPSTTGLLGISALSLVVWYIASSIYSWYRLRHFRGPFLASFSYIWIAWMTWSGKQFEYELYIGKKYGSVARIGPNYLFTDDPDLIRLMCSTKNSYPRSDWYDGARFNPYYPVMFIEKDPKVHDQMKMKLSSGYNGKDISGVEPDVDMQVMNLINLIRTKYLMLPGDKTRYLDFSRVIPFLTLDVISKLSLGKQLGCLETDSDIVGFYEALESYLLTLSLASNLPLVRNIVFSKLGLMLFGPKETDTKGMGRLMRVANAAVREVYAPEGKDENSILGSFVRHGLPQGQCESETAFMFVAGADTTAATIMITLLNVLAAPLVYNRLKEEVAATIRDGKVSHPITFAEARNLPYLKAVIYEGLRIRPVTTSILAKKVPPAGETFKGRFIPGGTEIGMNLGSMLRSKDPFGEDAEMFRPERFLEAGEGARADMQRSAEMAFSNGRWMCSGKHIALMEIHKVYFELFREFDFQIVNPRNPMSTTSIAQIVDKDFLVRVTKSSISSDAIN